jgi:hypothetical protein
MSYKRLGAAAALALLLATTAHAQFLGKTTLKGKRYVNGQVENVLCGGSFQNNLIDWSVSNERTLTVSPICTLAQDFPHVLGLPTITFRGAEQDVSSNGNPLNKKRYTGTIGAPPSGFIAGIEAELKYRMSGPEFTFRNEKGSIQYTTLDGLAQVVQFVGTYSAQCDPVQGFCTTP